MNAVQIWLQSDLAFILPDLSHWVALSDVGVLWNCLFMFNRKRPGLDVSARPALPDGFVSLLFNHKVLSDNCSLYVVFKGFNSFFFKKTFKSSMQLACILEWRLGPEACGLSRGHEGRSNLRCSFKAEIAGVCIDLSCPQGWLPLTSSSWSVYRNNLTAILQSL